MLHKAPIARPILGSKKSLAQISSAARPLVSIGSSQKTGRLLVPPHSHLDSDSDFFDSLVDSDSEQLSQAEMARIVSEVEANYDVRVIYAVEPERRDWLLAELGLPVALHFLYVRNNVSSYGAHFNQTSVDPRGNLMIKDRSSSALCDLTGLDVDLALRMCGEMKPLVVEMLYASASRRVRIRAPQAFVLVHDLREMIERRAKHFFPMLLANYRLAAYFNYETHLADAGAQVNADKYATAIRLEAIYEWLLLVHGSPHLAAEFKPQSDGKFVEADVRVALADLHSHGFVDERTHLAVRDLLESVKETAPSAANVRRRVKLVERVACIDEWIVGFRRDSFFFAQRAKPTMPTSSKESDQVYRELDQLFQSTIHSFQLE